jgi:hypothetical protein
MLLKCLGACDIDLNKIVLTSTLFSLMDVVKSLNRFSVLNIITWAFEFIAHKPLRFKHETNFWSSMSVVRAASRTEIAR